MPAAKVFFAVQHVFSGTIVWSCVRDEIVSLELMKRPVDPAIKAQIEQHR
jgi:hypothetical protein